MRSTLAGLVLTAALASDVSHAVQQAPIPQVPQQAAPAAAPAVPAAPAAAAAAAAASAVQPTDIAPKRYEAPVYSFSEPIRSHAHLSNWILGGVSQFTPAGLLLMDEMTGHEGSAWHHLPIHSDSFEIDIDIDVRGPPDARSSDGFALWLVDERDYGTFLRPPHGDGWNLFNYKPWYTGLGMFFSTNDRANNVRPSISAAVNNGTRSLDITKEVPSSDGIYFNYRNGRGPLQIHIVVTPENVRGSVRNVGDKEWRTAFSFKTEGRPLPKTPFLGITASNKRVAKGETTIPLGTNYGDRMLINRFEVTSDDLYWKAATLNPAQSILEHIVYDDTLEPTTQIRILSEAMLKHVVPRQDHLLAEISRLQQHNRMLTDRLDVLHTYLTRGASEERLREALDQIQSLVFKSSKDNSDKLEILQDKLADHNVEELKQSAAELHSSVLQSEKRALHLMLALGGVFLGVGFCLFKRMRDMEKKHIL